MIQPDGSNNVARGWYIFPYPEGQVGILSILYVEFPRGVERGSRLRETIIEGLPYWRCKQHAAKLVDFRCRPVAVS